MNEIEDTNAIKEEIYSGGLDHGRNVLKDERNWSGDHKSIIQENILNIIRVDRNEMRQSISRNGLEYTLNRFFYGTWSKTYKNDLMEMLLSQRGPDIRNEIIYCESHTLITAFKCKLRPKLCRLIMDVIGRQGIRREYISASSKEKRNTLLSALKARSGFRQIRDLIRLGGSDLVLFQDEFGRNSLDHVNQFYQQNK